MPQLDFAPDTEIASRFELRGSKEIVDSGLDELTKIDDLRGRAVVVDQRILGLMVQAGATDTTPTVLPLHVLPEQLRPVR